MEEFIQLNEAYEILTNPKFKVKPKIKPKPKETKKEAHNRWAKEERENIRKRAQAKAKLKPKILLRKTAKELFIKDSIRATLVAFPILLIISFISASETSSPYYEVDESIILYSIGFSIFLNIVFILLIGHFYFKRTKKVQKAKLLFSFLKDAIKVFIFFVTPGFIAYSYSRFLIPRRDLNPYFIDRCNEEITTLQDTAFSILSIGFILALVISLFFGMDYFRTYQSQKTK